MIYIYLLLILVNLSGGFMTDNNFLRFMCAVALTQSIFMLIQNMIVKERLYREGL